MDDAPPAPPPVRAELDRLVEEYGLEAVVETVGLWLRGIEAAHRPNASTAPAPKRKRGRPTGASPAKVPVDRSLLLAAVEHRRKTGAAAVWPSLLAAANGDESTARRLLRRLDGKNGADLRGAELGIFDLAFALNGLRRERVPRDRLADRLELMVRDCEYLVEAIAGARRRLRGGV